MRNLMITLLLSVIYSCNDSVIGQNLTAEKGSFGIDEEHNIIVWHQPNLNVLKSNYTTITFSKVSKFINTSSKLHFNNNITVSKNGVNYKLYITKLPIVHLNMDDSKMNSKTKILGSFTYKDSDQFIESVTGVRYRGNLSLTFAKKSFDLEFWNDAKTKEEKDVKFANMRSDGDWILDAMYNEPLRLRSFTAINFWNNNHKLYYADKEPKAQNGFDVKYVEVFKNGAYFGIYQLMESVDRKQLKLKKNKGKVIRGQMYKANSYQGGPDFTKISETYNNIFPHWNGWETDYPIIDYKSDFEHLYQFQELVINGTDEDFKSKIESFINLENAIDYYIFVNVIRATDNLGKNYYLAKYDQGEPFFFVPWDVDGTFGVIQDGKRIATTDDILTNGLFKRLIALSPNNYISNLKKRYMGLRQSEMSTENLLKSIDGIYKQFSKEKIYEREFTVWQNKLNAISNEAHYNYLKTWLSERMIYLDDYFKSL